MESCIPGLALDRQYEHGGVRDILHILREMSYRTSAFSTVAVHAKLVSGCIGKISFCRQNIIRIGMYQPQNQVHKQACDSAGPGNISILTYDMQYLFSCL